MGGEPPSLPPSGQPSPAPLLSCPFQTGDAWHSPPAVALHCFTLSSVPVPLSVPSSLLASEPSPSAPPSTTVYPHGNRLLYERLTSPGSARGAGGVHLAPKQLGSAVPLGKGLGQLRARGSVARPESSCLSGPGTRTAWPGVQELPVPWPSVSAVEEALGCLSAVRLSHSQSARTAFYSPSPARNPRCAERVPGRTCH